MLISARRWAFNGNASRDVFLRFSRSAKFHPGKSPSLSDLGHQPTAKFAQNCGEFWQFFSLKNLGFQTKLFAYYLGASGEFQQKSGQMAKAKSREEEVTPMDAVLCKKHCSSNYFLTNFCFQFTSLKASSKPILGICRCTTFCNSSIFC